MQRLPSWRSVSLSQERRSRIGMHVFQKFSACGHVLLRAIANSLNHAGNLSAQHCGRSDLVHIEEKKLHRTKKIPVKNIARQLRAYAMMSAAILASTPLVLRPLEAGPACEASPYSAPSLRVYCYLLCELLHTFRPI